MVLPILILVTSLALCLFYVQVTCRTILNREFQREYFRSVVSASRLEFLSVRKHLETSERGLNYSEARMALACDYLTLTYLLKNAANTERTYSRQERLLMLYFRALLASFSISHVLRLNERGAALKMTAVLQYFANVLGERVFQTALSSVSA